MPETRVILKQLIIKDSLVKLSTLGQWKQLADDILPLQVQFAHKPDEMQGSFAILEPDI